jgi:UDP-N-acetylglucosamine 2-epimerase (non-hydrolysing)
MATSRLSALPVRVPAAQRPDTERPVTIECGTNRLVGTDPDKIVQEAADALDAPATAARTPELWDGKAAARIWDVLEARALRLT